MSFFKDKIVWITGASSGIGEALTYALARENAKLIISSRRENELNRVRQNCATDPKNIFVLPLDLANVNSLKNKADEAVKQFGRIDILINNGGISHRSWSMDTSLDIDRKIMEINFFSYVALTKAVLPYMIKQKSGHIVVTSSILGKCGLPLRSAYASSKHALHGFFESLREEVYQDNINVLMLCPGFVRTNVTLNALTANGEPFNEMGDGQASGMIPEVCAGHILKAIRKKKLEVYIGGKEILTIYIKRLSQRLYLKIIRRVKTT